MGLLHHKSPLSVSPLCGPRLSLSFSQLAFSTGQNLAHGLWGSLCQELSAEKEFSLLGSRCSNLREGC